jgi:hypothetical protein
MLFLIRAILFFKKIIFDLENKLLFLKVWKEIENAIKL